jgi:hypothetical protein
MDCEGKIELEPELAINYSQIREHRKSTELIRQRPTRLRRVQLSVTIWARMQDQDLRLQLDADMNFGPAAQRPLPCPNRRPEGRRILSSTTGSAPLGKFSTLLYFSTGYQKRRLHRYDPIRRVLNMELLQFYYSPSVKPLLHRTYSSFIVRKTPATNAWTLPLPLK